jgi:hypothetical protein
MRSLENAGGVPVTCVSVRLFNYLEDPTMSETPEPQTPGPKPKKPLLPPSRIAVLIFVIVGVVVIVLQYRARSAFQASFQAVDEAMAEANAQGQPLYREDLDELLQGSPVRQAGQADRIRRGGPGAAYHVEMTRGLSPCTSPSGRASAPGPWLPALRR